MQFYILFIKTWYTLIYCAIIAFFLCFVFIFYISVHTWATIAHKIGISKDVISLALGHEFGCKTTGIYIDYDLEQIDKANRKVIDYINSLK